MLAALAFHAAVYHAACLAGSIACSHDVVARFWNERLAATPEDAARIEQWRAIFERAEKTAGLPAPAPLMPNYVGAFPALRLRASILSAAFDSRDAAGFVRRASALIGLADARELAGIAEQIEQRVDPWWRSEGRARAVAGVKVLHHPELPQRFDQIRRLLDASLTWRDLRVHVVPLPEGADSATTVGRHILMERPTPAVMLHESVHALFETSRRHRELMSHFDGAAAQPLYSNFNEALATAAQLLISPRDTYRDPVVTTLARALAPLLDQHRSIDDAFHRAYATAAPVDTRFRLSAVALTGDPASQAIFTEMVGPRYRVESEAEASLFAGLPLVRLIRMNPEALEIHRRDSRLVVTIVAPDDASLRRLIARLLESPLTD